jgi:hypothetical protein
MILIALHCTAPRARARAHKAASCDLIPTARIFLSNLITSHSPAPPVQSAEPGWIKVVQLAIGCESPVRAACTGAILEARARHAHTLYPGFPHQDFKWIRVDLRKRPSLTAPTFHGIRGIHSPASPRNAARSHQSYPAHSPACGPALPKILCKEWTTKHSLTHSLTHLQQPPRCRSDGGRE